MQKHRLVSIGIAVLAVLQAVFGVLRAFAYFRIGGELAGQGIILIPLVRAVVYGRGGLIILIALLSFVFAAGVLLGKRWGWWCGLIAAVFNILLVLGLLIDGERIAELILWLIVPVLVIWFLFSRFGWQPGYGSDETASI
jgi:hypothetical protein